MATAVVPVVALRVQDLNPSLNYTHVVDERGIQALGEFLDDVDEVGFDTETNITKTFYDRRIRTIQLGNKNEQFIVDLLALVGWSQDALIDAQGDFGCRVKNYPLLSLLLDILRPSLESARTVKVGHNIGFDYEVCKWNLGLRPWHLHDTQLIEQVIYAGAVRFDAKGYWALDDLIKRYLNIHIDKSQQKSFDLETPLTRDQLDYAAIDTRLPLALRALQKQVLKKFGLERTAQIENDAIPAFADMHLNGLKIDHDEWMKLVNETKEQHQQNLDNLDKCFTNIVGVKGIPAHDLVALEKKWRDEDDKVVRALNKKTFEAARRAVRAAEAEMPKCEGQAAINYGSPSQVLAALRKDGFTAKKLPTTNDRHLDKLAGNPTIDALRAFRETEKILKTYGEEFLEKYVDPRTGRIHSRFRQLGAETGRTSSTNPNVQNILNGANWRGCFVSRPGYKMLTIDYNGCELRIMCELSKEPVWLDAFLNNWDVHSVCAEFLFREVWTNAASEGCAYVAKHDKCSCKGHKDLRNKIKAINFGLAYGMEARKLSEGLHIFLEEAEELLEKYRAVFHVLIAYLKTSGLFATQKYESRTIGGRRRIYNKPTWAQAQSLCMADYKPDSGKPVPGSKEIGRKYYSMMGGIEREGKNTPIQGTNADMAKLALGCGFDPDGKPYAWHLIEPEYNAKLVNMVHDELLVEAPDDVAQACYDAVADAMTRAGAEFVKSIPMTTDGHIADRWTK